MYSNVLLFLFLLVPNHAIYVSVLELNHDSEKLESFLSVKVFIDDFQDVIRSFNSDYVQASNEKFVEANMTGISGYFEEHLTFKVNGKLEKMEFVSSVLVGDVYFLNFKIQSSSAWEKLEVKADYFIEIFPDQSNILTIKYGGEKYLARLTKSKPSYFIEF